MLFGKHDDFLQRRLFVSYAHMHTQYCVVWAGQIDGRMLLGKRKFTILMELARGEKLQRFVCDMLVYTTNACVNAAVKSDMFKGVGLLTT